MSQNINNKLKQVAVITGGGSGIGKATAKLLVEEGIRVALIDQDPSRVENTIKELEKIKGNNIQVLGLTADISKSDEVNQAIKKVVSQWERIDMLFANAGINGTTAPIEELGEEEWDETININLKGTFLTIKYAVPHLKKYGGSIVITSSINGVRLFSNSGRSAYAVSKAGQIALGKMLALELAAFKIRCNIICPGAIDTNIDQSTTNKDLENIDVPRVELPDGPHPLGDAGSAEEVAELVYFLLGPKSKHITGSEYLLMAQRLCYKEGSN